MPKRNNTNQPVSDSLRRFPRIRLANMYTIVCAVSAKNHPQILRSQVEQSRAADFCCDKETGAANTWAVLARRMMQSRRKSVPPDLLRVILLWHSDAACRPAGNVVRAHFRGGGKIRRGKVS